MSDAFTAAPLNSEDTCGAITQVRTRGQRIGGKGRWLLRVAILAGGLALIAQVLLWGTAPMTAFTEVDLPTLPEKVTQTTFTGTASSSTPFEAPLKKVLDLLSGPVVKGLMVLTIAIGVLSAMSSGNLTGALPLTIFPIVLLVTVNMSGFLLGYETGDDSNEKGEPSIEGAALRKSMAGYIAAQKEYLAGQPEKVKAALKSMEDTPTEWTPDWARMNVMETFSYGEAQSEGARKYVAQKTTYKKVLTVISTGGVEAALALGALGGGLFAFGTSLTRWAKRMEVMIGVDVVPPKKANIAKPRSLEHHNANSLKPSLITTASVKSPVYSGGAEVGATTIFSASCGESVGDCSGGNGGDGGGE